VRPLVEAAVADGGQGGVEERYLGWMALQGIGGPADLEASPCARTATAAPNLGVMAARGEGVPEDRDEAARWFRRADALGYPWREMCADAGFDPGAYVDDVGDSFADA
jgi:hypothetical protein